MALNKRRKNKIWKFRDYERIWFDNQEDIARMFINDFSKILKPKKLIIDPDMFDFFHPCISANENRELIKEAQEEKILITFS